MNSEERKADRQTEAWSLLWEQNVLASIDLFQEDAVSRALHDYWLSLGPSLANRSVLDVGAGNGALYQLFSRYGQRARRWINLDFARVSRSIAVQHDPSRLRILAETDFCTFVPDETVDLVVSNFGFEYAQPTQTAVAKAAEWLNPGGELRLVMHAAHSLPQQRAESARSALAFLDSLHYDDRVRDVLDAAETLPSDPIDRMMHGVEARDAYNQMVNQVKAVMEANGMIHPTLMLALQTANHLVQLAVNGQSRQAKETLASYRVHRNAEALRLEQMQACAKGANDMEILTGVLIEHRFSDVTVSLLECSEGLIAYIVTATRNS